MFISPRKNKFRKIKSCEDLIKLRKKFENPSQKRKYTKFRLHIKKNKISRRRSFSNIQHARKKKKSRTKLAKWIGKIAKNKKISYKIRKNIDYYRAKKFSLKLKKRSNILFPRYKYKFLEIPKLTQSNFFQIAGKYAIPDNGTFDMNLSSDARLIYRFLERCAREARNKLHFQPVKEVLRFLSNHADYNWLKKILLDKPVKGNNEQWTSGNHEWLLRSLIIDVVKRSAKMIKGIQSHAKSIGNLKEIDWLTIQANLRTPTKYLTYKNPQFSIKSGHCGAVKRWNNNKKKWVFSTANDKKGFHYLLKDAFNESKKIHGFMEKLKMILRKKTYTGREKYYVNPTKVQNKLIDGSYTNNYNQVNNFVINKIYPFGYKPTVNKIKTIKYQSQEAKGLNPTWDYASSDDEG
ncbi:hypothetical protein ACFL2K_02610 [Candidatus Margulisiibacteriota bacterium]